jgi:hypothetical protein
MSRRLNEIHGMQAAPLIVGASLPPSSMNKKYVDVKRHHTAGNSCHSACLLARCKCPRVEGGKDAQANVSLVACWTPDERIRSEYQVSVFSCLLVFGAAATSLQAHLTVMNWYLNLTNN